MYIQREGQDGRGILVRLFVQSQVLPVLWFQGREPFFSGAGVSPAQVRMGRSLRDGGGIVMGLFGTFSESLWPIRSRAGESRLRGNRATKKARLEHFPKFRSHPEIARAGRPRHKKSVSKSQHGHVILRNIITAFY